MSTDDSIVLQELLSAIRGDKYVEERIYDDVLVNRSIETLKYLLNAGVYYFGLSDPVARNNTEKIKYLLDNYGVNYDGRDDHVLMEAVNHGTFDTLQLLLDHFKTHKLPSVINLPEVLSRAAETRDFDFYHALYYYVPSNIKNPSFLNQFEGACRGRDLKIVEFLLSVTPDVNSVYITRGSVAAATAGNVETLKLMIDRVNDRTYVRCMVALIRKSDISWMMERGEPLLKPLEYQTLLCLAASYLRTDFIQTYADKVTDPVPFLRHAVCGPSTTTIEPGITESCRPQLVDPIMAKFGKDIPDEVVADLIVIAARRNWIRSGNALYTHRPVQLRRIVSAHSSTPPLFFPLK